LERQQEKIVKTKGQNSLKYYCCKDVPCFCFFRADNSAKKVVSIVPSKTGRFVNRLCPFGRKWSKTQTKMKTVTDFRKTVADHSDELSRTLRPLFGTVVNSMPLLLMQDSDHDDLVAVLDSKPSKAVPALFKVITAYGLPMWIQFFKALDKNHLSHARELFLSEQELAGEILGTDCSDLLFRYSHFRSQPLSVKELESQGGSREALSQTVPMSLQ